MTGPVGPEIPEPAERSLSGGVRLESVADIAEPADTDRDDNVRRGLDRAEDPGELDLDGAESYEDQTDWAWVEEWREGGEPVPWGPGLTLAGFTLILVASAVYVLSSGLWDRPILAIAVNVLVAAGLGPGAVAVPRTPRAALDRRRRGRRRPGRLAVRARFPGLTPGYPRAAPPGHQEPGSKPAVRPAIPARKSAARRTVRRR